MNRTLLAVRAPFLLASVLLIASCDETDTPSSPTADPPADAQPPALATSSSGIPFGPYNLWANPTEVEWGPSPFTSSMDNSSFPTSIVKRIAAARQNRMHIMLAMTDGLTENLTNGRFDLSKWKSRMNAMNTSEIRKAVADGVADGTIVANKMLDEPESPQWGGVVTKSMLDQMATYAKNIFPTLPMGVTHGAPGFKWQSGQHYKVLDWVGVQYVYNYNQGNVNGWRDEVLSFARANGVTPAFSLNILNGGVRDQTGAWDCPNTGGKGTRSTYCRMTADQVATYGKAAGPYGCAMLMWKYDGAFMSKSANVTAFKDVASFLSSKPRKSCRRP